MTMGGCALGCMCVWVEDAACFYRVPGVSVDVSLEAVGRRLASAGSIGVFGQRAQRPHAMDGWGVHGCYVVGEVEEWRRCDVPWRRAEGRKVGRPQPRLVSGATCVVELDYATMGARGWVMRRSSDARFGCVTLRTG